MIAKNKTVRLNFFILLTKMSDADNMMYKEKQLMDIFEEVCGIIRGSLNLDEDVVLTEETQTEDINADSLDMVEIIMEIEDEYGIEIPDEELDKFGNIGDIVSFVSSQIN